VTAIPERRTRAHHTRRRIVLLAAVALVLTVAVPTVVAGRSVAHGEIAPAGVPSDQPQLGLRYAGLTPGKVGGPCPGVYRVSGTDLCSHGPDAPPPGLAVDRDVAPVAPVARGANGATTAASSVVCDGDGITGKRVQVLYVRGTDTASRFVQYLESFRAWATGVDGIYDASAQETGGSRHVRFVSTADCAVDVQEAEVPSAAIADFGATINALKALGYNRSDRKYMIFADADVYCGIGSFAGDDRPDAANRSNRGPSYGRSDSGCWAPSVAAHELGHNLGAVNDSAPNSSKAGHCLDEYDLMCYNDSGGLKTRVVCADRSHEQRLDCNHDDYYNTGPSPGSYLDTHWDVANNEFLIGGSGPIPNPSATSGPGPGAR
jgi:hypothetical protein